VKSHTRSLPFSLSGPRPYSLYLELELRLASPPSLPVNLSCSLSFLPNLRLQLPLQQFQFEFSSLDGSDDGGGVYVRQNFTFQLVASFWQTKFNSLPLPLKVEPLVRWGLQLCGRKDVG
jgi:hypothetical protein